MRSDQELRLSYDSKFFPQVEQLRLNSCVVMPSRSPQVYEKSQEAAITIQKAFRGFINKKKYGIRHLNNSQLEKYPTFVVGNDPCMPKTLDTYHEPTEKIALIGTSGMRAVELACKLGNPHNTPKIIIIDNSLEVYQFWYKMREFAQDETLSGTQTLFIKHLPKFLEDNKALYRKLPANNYNNPKLPDIKHPNQDIEVYFHALINEFGYKYMRHVISHASLIKQSWADPNVFIKIQNIMNYQEIRKIYMYPSNIVACIQDEKVCDDILKNIENIFPVLSIHTDVCLGHYYPERVFVIENQNSNIARNTIFKPHKDCKKFMEHSFFLQLKFLMGIATQDTVITYNRYFK